VIRIATKIVSLGPWAMPYPSKKFRQNPFTSLQVIRWTDRQTDRTKNITSYFGGGKNDTLFLLENLTQKWTNFYKLWYTKSSKKFDTSVYAFVHHTSKMSLSLYYLVKSRTRSNDWNYMINCIKGLVQPCLQCCNIVWEIHQSTALNSLYLLQKKLYEL